MLVYQYVFASVFFFFNKLQVETNKVNTLTYWIYPFRF